MLGGAQVQRVEVFIGSHDSLGNYCAAIDT
jgi:hypothetical protein